MEFHIRLQFICTTLHYATNNAGEFNGVVSVFSRNISIVSDRAECAGELYSSIKTFDSRWFFHGLLFGSFEEKIRRKITIEEQ